MDIHKIDWSAIPWKQIRKGVEQKAFSGNAATVALHRLMPGHEPRPHSHPHEQVGLMLSGTAEFTIGEETQTIGPGQMWRIPGGVVHKVVAGDQPVRALDVFHPIRDDYR